MSTTTQLYEALKALKTASAAVGNLDHAGLAVPNEMWADLYAANNAAAGAIADYEAEQKARAENMANENTKDFLNQAAKAVHARLPDNYGFIVFAFPHNGGRMLYASNAERKGAVNALKEWLIQASGEEEWLKHIQ